MSEIIKLYENVGIEKRLLCGDRDVLCGHVRPDGKSRLAFGCFGCEYKNDNYPPFTAEKQLAIFKIFCRRYLAVSQHVEENGDLCFGIRATVGDYAVGFNKDFAECLADFVNSLWQDLTDQEKEEIRRILNEK